MSRFVYEPSIDRIAYSGVVTVKLMYVFLWMQHAALASAVVRQQPTAAARRFYRQCDAAVAIPAGGPTATTVVSTGCIHIHSDIIIRPEAPVSASGLERTFATRNGAPNIAAGRSLPRQHGRDPDSPERAPGWDGRQQTVGIRITVPSVDWDGQTNWPWLTTTGNVLRLRTRSVNEQRWGRSSKWCYNWPPEFVCLWFNVAVIIDLVLVSKVNCWSRRDNRPGSGIESELLKSPW